MTLAKLSLPGPIAEAAVGCVVHDQTARIIVLNGPVGSGKTTAMHVMAPLQRAMLMPPSPVDGVRRYKLGVLRQTHTDLERTAIKTYRSWVDKGEFRGGPPASHASTWHIQDPNTGQPSRLEVTIEWRGIGDQSVEALVRSWDLTDAYVNELDLMDVQGLPHILGRCGRYPGARHLPDGYDLVGKLFADCNAFSVDHGLYPLCFEGAGGGMFRFYRQPGGTDARAENRQHLPARYYEDLIEANSAIDPEWVARMVHNKPGYNRDGKPVFADSYASQVHAAEGTIDVLPKIPLNVGIDQGGNPGVVIGQQSPDGQHRILAELMPRNVTADVLGAQITELLASPRFAGARIETAFADPAAFAFNASSPGGASWAETLALYAPIRLLPAPSNALLDRLAAVRLPLSEMVGGRPRLVIDPSCVQLRRAMAADYKYKKIKYGARTEYSETPLKNDAADIADALQYYCMGVGEYHKVKRQAEAVKAIRSGVVQMQVGGGDVWQM